MRFCENVHRKMLSDPRDSYYGLYDPKCRRKTAFTAVSRQNGRKTVKNWANLIKNGNFYENALFFRIFCYHQHQICGGVPERSNGTDCKSVAFGFDGSNPSPSTRFSVVRFLFLNPPSSVPCFFWLYSVFGHGKFLIFAFVCHTFSETYSDAPGIIWRRPLN